MKIFKTPRIARLIYKRKTWGFLLDKNAIYLTFDDGPHPAITPWILDFLKAQKIKATFFCVGENVVRYPEIYQRILQEGHAVGNHTMKHENAHKTNSVAYLNSIQEASNHIHSKLFRPPYGRLTSRLTKTISKEYEIIMWSWLSYDFSDSTSINTILEKAKKQIKGGAIIVLHDNPKISEKQKELLPQLYHILKEKQLEFLTIPH